MDSVVAPPPAILVVAARSGEPVDVVEALRNEGCHPLAVGTEGRELERAAALGPAVILLDAEAGPDAFALCRRLKTGAATRDIPVILILSGTDADGRAAAFAAGATDCLTRPLVREEALARIRPHLRLATVERQLNARNGELERLRAEHSAELQSSAELLRLKSCALSHVREAVELIDSEGRFRYVNEEACRALGYSAPELLGMRVPDIDPNWTPDAFAEQWQRLAAAGTLRFESRHRRKDGPLFDVEIVANHFTYHGREYCLSLVRDITEQRQTERELGLLTSAIDRVHETIYLLDEDGRIRYLNEEACRKLGYSAEELIGMPLEKIDPAVPPATYLENWQELVATGRWRGESAHYRRDGSRFPIEVEARLIEHDGEPYCLCYVTDITDRKKTQRELRLLDQAVNQSTEAAFLMDALGGFVYVNEAACRSLGYSREELLAMSVFDIDALLKPETIRTMFCQTLAGTGSKGTVETLHRRRDGGVFPVELSSSVVESDDARYVLSLVRDVTERKRAQRELLLLEQAVNRSQESVFLMNMAGRFIYVNDAACASLGYRRDELLRMGPLDIDADMPPEVFRKLADEFFARGPTRGFIESRHRRRDGSTFAVEVGASLFEHGGERLCLTLVRDITARKEAERRLHESEQQFRTLAENSPDVIVRYDREGRRLYVNPAVVKLWGHPAERLLGSTPGENAGIVNLQAYLEAIRAVFETGRTVSVEVEHRNATGELGWSSSMLVPAFGADGRVDSVLAIGHDITEIKKSELRFRTLAENLPENIIRHDRQGRMVYVNPRMLKTWGLTSAEGVLGKTLIEAFGHEASHRYHPMHMKVMETREPLTYDYTVPDTGDGERIHEIHVVPECNEAGEVVGALAIGRDITRRRKTERELALLDRAVNQSHDAFFLIDLDMRLRYVNDAAVRGLGYDRDELLGMKLPAIDPCVDPVQLREWMRQTAAAGQFPGTIETCHRAKDGRVFPVEVSAASIDYDGDILYLTVARDIGERKRAEQERLDHLRFLETMDRINDAIREAAGMDRMTSAVLDIVLALFECDRAFLIHPCDPDAEAWQVPFERTRPEYPGAGSENARVPMDATAADAMRRQLEADGPLAFGPGNELPLPKTAERFGFRSLMSAALRPAIGKPWVFGLQQCSRERAWTPAERRLLQEIGRRLEDGLTGMLAHGILRDSELRYREIFQNATDAIMIWDVTPEGRFRLLDVNPVWEKLTGADHRRMAGLCLDDVDRNAAARDALAQLRACLVSAAPLSYEDGLKTPTGEWRLHTTLVPVADAEGRIYRVVSIGRDITAQKRAEVRLRESYAMLQELAARRDSAREEERTRIAREIHDELGQHLTALRMGISTVGFEFRDSQPLLVERVQRLTGLADQTIKVVRNVAAALRPAVLDSGVAAALEWLVSEFQRHTGIACSVAVQAAMPHIDAYRAVALFRIVQESLTNVARHARAETVAVSLRSEDDKCVLEIRDDGCGFAPEGPRSRSFGLTGMRERALMLGGEITIESQPGNGTAVRLIIPLDSEKVPT